MNLIPSNLKALLYTALVSGVGAALTYLLQNFGSLDFGALTPLVVAVLTVLSHYLHQAVTPAPVPPPA